MDPFANNPQFVEDFRTGVASALEKVYRTFYRPLRNFVLRGFAFQSEGRQLYFGGLAQDQDVEDIIQETFRRAFGERARNSYDGIRPYKNYLFTIARNAVITDMSNRHRLIPVGEALTRDTPSEELSPLEAWVMAQRSVSGQEGDGFTSEDCLENLEIFGLVEGFLRSLTNEEQEFFKLRFLGQCSQEKTARRMGWNRARVRKWEARLRKAFLSHLSGSGYLEMRAETLKVRRIQDPERHQETLSMSRSIWRTGLAEVRHDYIFEAA